MTAVYFGQSLKKVPIYKVQTEQKKVALTFDAAWGADKTMEIAKILNENGAKATFFLVEFWVNKFPDLVKGLDEQGFEIGTHSKTHPKMSQLSSEKITCELSESAKAIENIINKKVDLFRPPFGDYNDMLLQKAKECGLFTIQWSIDSLDWKKLTSEQIVQRVVKRVSAGDIILFHNNSDNVLTFLPTIISILKIKGYQMVTVGDLIYKDNYKITSEGVQMSSNS